MDPSEDLVARQRAHIDAHYAEIARLASVKPDVVLVDQPVAETEAEAKGWDDNQAEG